MNINLTVIKKEFIKTERYYAEVFNKEYNDSWQSGTFIFRTSLNNNFKFIYSYDLLDENSKNFKVGECPFNNFDSNNEDLKNIYHELKSYFKQGITTGKFNEIQIRVENNEFVSYTPAWNQELIDSYNNITFFSQMYRVKYIGQFKPWFLDERHFTELPTINEVIPNSIIINSLSSLTQYLQDISVSKKLNWDCTFLTFQISDFSSIYSLTKEEYIYTEHQDLATDKPHMFIQKIILRTEDFKKIFTEFKKANLWDAYTIEFQLKADGTFEYYVFTGCKEWINRRDINSKSYDEFEKQLTEELNEDLSQSNEPITSDYLLKNIYDYISGYIPIDFESIKIIISRNFTGETEHFSGKYFYKPKGWFRKFKPTEPGIQIYPLNLASRFLDEFYTQNSKNWSLAVLTLKNDGTCKVKIKK